MPIIIIMLLLITAIFFPKLIQYNRSQYKEESGNGFGTTVFNKDNYGEFLAFTYLEEYEIYRKLVTNRRFLEKDQGQGAIALELIMIHEGGVYVFDVNNCQGMVKGDGKSQHWTRSYKNKEETFKNPFLKNNERIQLLKSYFPELEESRFKSYVLFNNNCTLAMEERDFEQGVVLKMMELIKHLNEELLESEKVLSKAEIDNIYEVIKNKTVKGETPKKETGKP